MAKIKKVLIEEDRLNKPKYLETFEHKGFVYGLEIHFKGRAIYEGGWRVGLTNPYITLTKYKLVHYISETYDFRKPLETFDLDIPQDFSWSLIPTFVRQKLQNDFIKTKYEEWLSVSKLSEEKRFSFLNSLSKIDQEHLIEYGKKIEEIAND